MSKWDLFLASIGVFAVLLAIIGCSNVQPKKSTFFDNDD